MALGGPIRPVRLGRSEHGGFASVRLVRSELGGLGSSLWRSKTHDRYKGAYKNVVWLERLAVCRVGVACCRTCIVRIFTPSRPRQTVVVFLSYSHFDDQPDAKGPRLAAGLLATRVRV